MYVYVYPCQSVSLSQEWVLEKGTHPEKMTTPLVVWACQNRTYIMYMYMYMQHVVYLISMLAIRERKRKEGEIERKGDSKGRRQ